MTHGVKFPDDLELGSISRSSFLPPTHPGFPLVVTKNPVDGVHSSNIKGVRYV